MRRLLISLIGLSLMASACAGPSVLISNEAVRPPETPPPVLPLVVLAADDLTPLVAQVTVDGAPAQTDVTGRTSVIWEESWENRSISFEISVPGFHEATFDLDRIPDEPPLEVRMEPVVLLGTVATNAGAPMKDVSVELNGEVTVTDPDGDFRFQRATPGSLVATRPAWADTVAPWDGTVPEVALTLEPRIEFGLRVGPAKVADQSEWRALLSLADNTEVSAFVLDTKDERGSVHYETSVDTANDIGAVVGGYDVETALADMDDHDLYKIARIAVFQDNQLARAQPHLAVHDATKGGLWEARNGSAWLDPTDIESWDYSLALAEEACSLGFDEIQFEGVTFPSGGSVIALEFDSSEFVFETVDEYLAVSNQDLRVEAIGAFLAEARTRLNPDGCAVAFTAPSITFHGRTDEGVGLLPGPLSHVADVYSPTIYANSYQPGWNGYEDPNDFAPRIVSDVLNTGLPRIEGLAIVRPWLQRVHLAAADINAEQDEATQRGLGWMLWSESSSYDRSFLRSVR